MKIGSAIAIHTLFKGVKEFLPLYCTCIVRFVYSLVQQISTQCQWAVVISCRLEQWNPKFTSGSKLNFARILSNSVKIQYKGSEHNVASSNSAQSRPHFSHGRKLNWTYECTVQCTALESEKRFRKARVLRLRLRDVQSCLESRHKSTRATFVLFEPK